MLIREHWKKSWRMLLVSTLLVFMLNTMPASATFVDYEDQVRWDLSVISEMLDLIYISLETYLPDISELISDLEDYLSEIQNYVNASASQLLLSNSYLNKIESHLAIIASNSGSSDGSSSDGSSSDGSSSGTDLSGITTKLDTLTGLIGIIQLRADTLISQLESTNTYLSAVSTKLDGVSTMVTDLATVKTYLSWIDSEVEDVLESLETATGLIGTISLDVDALVTGMGVTQELIAAANTNLTTMINKQELVFDYLADLSGDLGTVISNQSAALPVLEEMSDILSAISDDLNSVRNRMSHNGITSARYLYDIDQKLNSALDTLSSDQQSILTLLQQEGAFTTDISGVLADLGILISNQEELLALLQHEGAFTTDISGVLADLGTVISNQSAAFSVLEELSDILSTISDDLDFVKTRMTYNGFTSAHYLYDIDKKLNSALDTLSSDQQSILALLQQEGAFTTDISGVLENQQWHLNAFIDMVNSLNYQGMSIAQLGYEIFSDLSGVLENQQKLIDLIEDLEITTNVTIENIENITIDVTNKAYEIFYITDSDGNEQNLADFSGDVLTISGRLLNFFFKVAFDDALDSVDSALDDMTEFYIDDSVLVGGGSLWE